jgi:hypothetical protein
MKVFFVVLARNHRDVQSKIDELAKLGFPYLIVCGERIDYPNVVYRKPIGKWDAINFGYGLVPPDTDVVALNDVDTVIHKVEDALLLVRSHDDFVYSAVKPIGGLQPRFYAIANPLNRFLKVFAMGELIFVRKKKLDKLMPVPPCLAEDTYLMFKAMELKYRIDFCEETYLTTKRTETTDDEVLYKERTTLGILQALSHSSPPPWVRLFYGGLPLLAIMLYCRGRDGRTWSKGIFRALRLYIQKSNRSSF